jgi:hypothetical protein
MIAFFSNKKPTNRTIYLNFIQETRPQSVTDKIEFLPSHAKTPSPHSHLLYVLVVFTVIEKNRIKDACDDESLHAHFKGPVKQGNLPHATSLLHR